MSKGGHQAISQAAIRAGFASGSNMDEQVGNDIKNSLAFFQQLYGPPVASRMRAAEIPEGHGEAFPGFLHLAWSTFQFTDDQGINTAFRAHEVAHQWWGIGVNFKSYHDQWLSEGFAEYSALSYVLAVEKKSDKFFDLLRKAKDAILSNRKYLFGSGQQAGPIWLGYRTSSSSTAGDYDLIVYKKGAWVLHMLRNMLLDLQTMNEDRFKRIMKTFYSQYVGKQASTADFRKVVEQEMGVKMDWFFRQWVERTEIPKYQFAYHSAKTEDGKVKVSVRIRQLGVPGDFQMAVPLLVNFGERRFARTRAIVNRPLVAFDLMLPMEPEEVKFNDMESVLCEVEDVSWDEALKW
jgi:aminopeptidase N